MTNSVIWFNTFMKKLLKVLASVLISLVLIVLIGAAIIFLPNQKPRSGPDLGHGIEQVADMIATIYLFEVDHGKIVLIDAGNDPEGTAIMDALKKRGKTADDVAAIFVTHAHPDHTGALSKFSKALVFAMKEEAPLIEGKEKYLSPVATVTGQYIPRPVKVTNPLNDGETVTVHGLKVTAYRVSGHTPGSALYLARGVLFLGDIAGIGRNKTIRDPVYIFSRSVEESNQSLAIALQKLEPRYKEIEFVTSSHSGTLAGPEGVKALLDHVSKTTSRAQ